MYQIKSLISRQARSQKIGRCFNAKLAVGYLLDELKNDITRETPASFEPIV